MKRVVFINRSFYPDIEATGQFYTELAEFLSDSFDVTFVAGLSYYLKIKGFGIRLWRKEKFKNIKIIRVRHTLFWKGNPAGRVLNWLSFSFLSFFVLFRLKPEILVCGTDPPILGIFSYILRKLKGIKFIYHCNDLYPDVAIALGTFKKGMITDVFDYFNKKALKWSMRVIALGEDMAELLKKKGIKNEKIEVIPNWVDTEKIYPVQREENIFLKKYKIENKFVIMYSGNIGLTQNLEVLIDALDRVDREKEWVMVFVGDGVKKDEIVKRVNQKGLKGRVLFLPYQLKEFLSNSLSSADIHIVSLKKEAKGTCVPSKVYGILASGRPFISISDENSSSSIIAKKYGCGIVADPEDVEDIKNKIEWAIENKEILENMGKKAREVAVLKFDKKRVLERWKYFLEGIN